MTVRSFHLDTCTNRLLPVAEDMVIRPQGGFVLHNEELIHSSLSLTHTQSQQPADTSVRKNRPKESCAFLI